MSKVQGSRTLGGGGFELRPEVEQEDYCVVDIPRLNRRLEEK